MTTKKPAETELTALQGEGDTITLTSGTEIRVERLRTRQLFKFVRILTSGAGQILASLNLSRDQDPAEFAGQLIALTVIAIPEAEDEAIEFIRSLVTPVGLVDAKTKADREKNIELIESVYEELENPELDDVIAIFEKVIEAEAEHIQALGKKIISLISVPR